ncbi:MAG: bifunctional diguanylate cyclase/phosphodiesterase [Pseudomonadota bacterium]
MRVYLKPIFIAIVVIGISVLAVTRFSDNLVDKTLLGHAEGSSQTWRTKLIETVPDIETIFESGATSRQQQELIEASMAGSDIFRFVAFAPDGRQSFLSDQSILNLGDQRAFSPTAAEVIASGNWDIKVKDGTQKDNRPDLYVETYMPVYGDDGAILGVIESYVDVTALAAALGNEFNSLSVILISVTALIYLVPTMLLIRRNEQLREKDQAVLRLSKRDPLTGLLNRGAFNEETSRLFGSEDTRQHTLGIAFIDLDKFKEINDTHGHDAGDQLLKHVAGILTQAVNEGGIVARLGGDEFVILCPGATHESLARLGERLMELASEAPLPVADTEVYPSLSVGVHLSDPGETERRALHRADLALYQAKANGRSQVTAYSADVELKDLRRRKIAQDVRTALDDNRFFLEFQPIFRETDQVEAFEALLRLRSTDGDLIPPIEFIPIAEDAGQIDDIGRWVIREAIKAATDWPEHIFVTINVSVLQFRSGALPDDVKSVIDETGIEASRICLELTERVLIVDQQNVAEQLADIKALGIQIAIDDFGTGYSSLSYLWQYEFNILKLDKSFFEAYAFDGVRYAKIIASVIDLGHQLNMSVVVEGVETQEQLDFLQSTDCDFAQGFFLGRPMPIEKARSLARGTGPRLVSARPTGS